MRLSRFLLSGVTANICGGNALQAKAVPKTWMQVTRGMGQDDGWRRSGFEKRAERRAHSVVHGVGRGHGGQGHEDGLARCHGGQAKRRDEPGLGLAASGQVFDDDQAWPGRRKAPHVVLHRTRCGNGREIVCKRRNVAKPGGQDAACRDGISRGGQGAISKIHVRDRLGIIRRGA